MYCTTLKHYVNFNNMLFLPYYPPCAIKTEQLHQECLDPFVCSESTLQSNFTAVSHHFIPSSSQSPTTEVGSTDVLASLILFHCANMLDPSKPLKLIQQDHPPLILFLFYLSLDPLV
ncbi:hypothetical protein CDAR_32921 [Caerostris darwini]|uniref:Uncharacterized protein n=1 Tax=Caerostris darwini TaxID=1538125 RepID=A0AAV4SIE3_9ARAC|nr:hypothetical protein CDAR_32921 [Caerostris darwini]